jgi:hypothetical protein
VSHGPLVKIEAPAAAGICARFDVKKDALALLREGMTPAEFLEALMANRQFVTGIDFMAHALAAREGVWWGSLCVQHACGNSLSAPDRAALRAAVEWVLRPTEANRAAAQAPAQAAGPVSAAGALALVASLKGSAEAAPMPPAKAVANAVKTATIKGEPARFADTQRLFVELGIGVAEGRFSWTECGSRG